MHRRVALLAGLVAALGVAGHALADEVTVPVDLQVQLLDRVARYERGWATDRSPAHALVVSRVGSAESQRVASQLVQLLGQTPTLGGRAIEVRVHAFGGASGLAGQVRGEGADLVYLTPALGPEVPAITRALDGLGVLTVSSVGADVDRGAIVGFELVSSRPRIAINLARAREQRLRFDAQFLRLVRVVE